MSGIEHPAQINIAAVLECLYCLETLKARRRSVFTQTQYFNNWEVLYRLSIKLLHVVDVWIRKNTRFFI